MEYIMLAVAIIVVLISMTFCIFMRKKYVAMRKEMEKSFLRPKELNEDVASKEITENPLVATELLEILGIKDPLHATTEFLKEQKKLQTGIINANIADFERIIQHMEVEQVYRFINQTLACCIPAVYENDGILNAFQEAGLSVLFQNNLEEGLNAAVSICEEIVRCNDSEHYQKFAIGLCYGDVMVGMVGQEKRLFVLTLSTYTGFVNFLQKTAPKYYARILATGSYVERIEKLNKKYNSRFLGYFYISSTDTLEKVFDIFDGDTAGIRNLKRKTRMMFEKGVYLFLEGDFAEARNYFIEVLKTDRTDRAAREYVLLCDKYRNVEKEQTKVYIEIY